MEEQPERKFYGYELVKVNTPYGWLGSSADRIARYMVRDGILNRERIGKYVRYWLKNNIKPEPKRTVKIINNVPTEVWI
jgi:hypothetical protein